MELTESQKKTMLLLDLDHRLQSFEMNLSHFDLPVPTEDDLAQVTQYIYIITLLG